jgi:hypothetical protein
MLKTILITAGIGLVMAVVVALVGVGERDVRIDAAILSAPAASSAAVEPAIAVPAPAEVVLEDPPSPPPPNAPVQKAQAEVSIAKNLRDRQETLQKLPKGKIVLDAPKVMKVGEVGEVHANVGINVPVEVLQRYSRTTNQSTVEALRISSEMMAVLTGPGFKITATQPELQSVSEGFPTVWSWDIEARKEGEQVLEATLYVLLPSADKSSRQRVDSYTHKIGVSVKEQTWGEWLTSRKEEIDAVKALTLTGVGAITAMLGWLGWSYGSRKKNEFT